MKGIPRLTVTRHAGEKDVHIYHELFSPRAIYDDRGLQVDSAVIDEFQDGGYGDDCKRDKGH